jgi:hypothetical protein
MEDLWEGRKMKTRKMFVILVLVSGLMVCSAKITEAEPMGTEITYQGRLMDGNEPADGLYDFQVELYDEPNDGNQIGPTNEINGVSVNDGYFTFELDFGPVWDAEIKYPEFKIRRKPDPCDPGPPKEFKKLKRQKLTGGACAQYAEVAAMANYVDPCTFAPYYVKKTGGTVDGGLVVTGTCKSGYCDTDGLAVRGDAAVAGVCRAGSIETAGLCQSGYSRTDGLDVQGNASVAGTCSVGRCEVAEDLTALRGEIEAFTARTLKAERINTDGFVGAWTEIDWAKIKALLAENGELMDLTVTGQLTIPGGAGVDKVLTSDASGVATWQTPLTGGDITAVTAGAGLTGGGTSGDVSLAVDATIARVAEIMPRVLVADGSGSALDADLLDGLDSTAFAATAHPHSGSDITSGTVAEARIDAAVSRDAEVAAAVASKAASVHGHLGSDITGTVAAASSAETLDGLDSTSFVLKSGDTMGPLSVASLDVAGGLTVSGAVSLPPNSIDFPKLANPLSLGEAMTWIINGGRIQMNRPVGPDYALEVNSNSPDGGCAKFSKGPGPSPQPALEASGHEGIIAKLSKFFNYGQPAVKVQAATPSSPGLQVEGSFSATGTKSAIIQTSQGPEAIFCVEGPEVEIYSSGSACLSAGAANVAFDRLFTEAVSEEVEVRVTVTPVGGWSALYVESNSVNGFDVRSAGGDENVEFHWMACGRRKGYETRPQ